MAFERIKEIENPHFLKTLSYFELEKYAEEIRQFIVEVLAVKGGHLSSNLGVVELTMALHRNFNTPVDRVFFDVGHQAYTHKIITGRAKEFLNLREFEGLSGFQKRSESDYDCFEAGHAATSISAAVGMAIARDLNKDSYQVVPVVGDASIVSGLSLEALNHLGSIKNKVIIILNDNEMGISKSIGGFSKILSRARTDYKYVATKKKVKNFLFKIPLIGKLIVYFFYGIKKIFKRVLLKENIFDNFNLGYIGPVDGHNFKKLDKALKNSKAYPGSIVVHVVTKKGKGYKYSESDEVGNWHGVSPFIKASGASAKQSDLSWSEIMARIIEKEMQKNESIVAITPAMIVGSKLENIFKLYPERSIDVGIAEEHAFTMASGLSLNNKLPFISIYSSFMQRSYDQIVHDIARMNLATLVAVERAGIIGQDGETHQGIFDSGFLIDIPNTIISMAKNNQELEQLVKLGIQSKSPYFIRLSREKAIESSSKYNFKIGEWEVWECNNSNGCLISYGPIINELFKIAEKYRLTLINARYIKPLDEQVLIKIAGTNKDIFIYDLYATYNGLTSAISKFYQLKNLSVNLHPLTLPSKFIEQGSIKELEAYLEVNVYSLEKFIKERLK